MRERGCRIDQAREIAEGDAADDHQYRTIRSISVVVPSFLPDGAAYDRMVIESRGACVTTASSRPFAARQSACR